MHRHSQETGEYRRGVNGVRADENGPLTAETFLPTLRIQTFDRRLLPYKPALSAGAPYATLLRVNRLTRQEQLVLCIIMGLLLTGWAVKAYRAAHPPAEAAQPVKT
jgi:hypothetical protein